MSRHSGVIRYSGRALGPAPFLEILAGPTDYPNILEIHHSNPLNSAGGALYETALVGSSAVGVANQPVLVGPENSFLPSCGVTLATNWTVLPTVPSQYFRQWPLANFPSANTVKIYRLGNGIKLNPNTSLVLWILTGNNSLVESTIDFTVVLDA